jgi:DNA-binding winged helix-turn-helix (wHTH) protein
MLIYRLRSLLERHGENPFLVQHNRRLGYRFAVRCGAGAVTDRDNQ